jgi:5-hydroxyisourate hydrolase
MSPITTHVLDTSRGRPAAGIGVVLEIQSGGSWTELGRGVTNADGRLADLLPAGKLDPAIYRLRFDTAAYFKAQDVAFFYPYVAVVFEVRDPREHHHVPLLLSPFGYSTYRGT